MHLHLWRRLLLSTAVVAMLVVVARAYEPAQDAAFVWDDHILAERDAHFRHLSVGEILTGPFWPETALADARAPYYRPLVLLSLRLDMLAGGTAAVFHRTNILLHLIGCVLLAVSAIRLGARATGAVVAALTWGLAPRLSEAVVWISGRTDVLSCVLGLAALATCPDATATRRTRRMPVTVALSILSGVLLLGALWSKEVAIAFGVALAIAILESRKTEGLSRAWMGRLFTNVVAPAAVYLLLRHFALHGPTPSVRPLGAGRRVATAFEAVGRYAEMLADPLRPQTMIGMLGEIDVPRALAGGIVLLAAAVGVVRLRHRAPVGVRVGTAVTGVSLGLVLHLIPFTLAGAVTADRLLYVPLAGMAIAVVVALEGARANLRFASGLVALVVAYASFAATRARAADYQDEALFWVVAAERAHPSNTTPLSSLARVLREAEQTELACRLYEKADVVLAASERVGLAAHRRARENLVSCLATIGRYDDAHKIAEELARTYPDSGRIQMELGFSRLHIRDFDGAAEAFAASLRKEPALASFVRPAEHDLALARKDAPTFADPSRQITERARYARYLARIGHLPEAEVVHLAIAEDEAAPSDDRSMSVEFLTMHGRLPLARRAVLALSTLPGLDLTDARRNLAIRQDRYERVHRLLPRISALAGG